MCNNYHEMAEETIREKTRVVKVRGRPERRRENIELRMRGASARRLRGRCATRTGVNTLANICAIDRAAFPARRTTGFPA